MTSVSATTPPAKSRCGPAATSRTHRARGRTSMIVSTARRFARALAPVLLAGAACAALAQPAVNPGANPDQPAAPPSPPGAPAAKTPVQPYPGGLFPSVRNEDA